MLRRKRELHTFIVINTFIGDTLSDALEELLSTMKRNPKSCHAYGRDWLLWIMRPDFISTNHLVLRTRMRELTSQMPLKEP